MRRLSTYFLILLMFAALATPAVAQAPTTIEAPATSVRTDILPGVELTVEEVEPGVFHVLNDGVHDLVLGSNTDIVAGHDDGIYLLRKNQFIRLGSAAGHAWPEGGRPLRGDPSLGGDGFEVTPDGTVWVFRRGNPWHGGDSRFRGSSFSSDGDGWNRIQSPGHIWTMAVAPDGTLWASW